METSQIIKTKISTRFCMAWLLSLLFITGFEVRAGDTLLIRTHDRQTVVTDPSKGFSLYKAWGKFPPADMPIRKIILQVRFGCPDTLRCADWDYKDHITIRRKGGVNGASQDYEIGRMLTPYGGAFGKDWRFGWEVDVTDFSLLLRDSVEIEYNHTGWEPNNDRGWSVTLDFVVVKGTPAWQPVSIQKVYDGSFRYGDSSNSIEQALKPVVFSSHPEARFARLRVVQTGHGMDKPDGCAEFCSKYRELWYDGKLVDKKDIWKSCGSNPLYPQAGTWVFDRGNWCPGDLMQPDVYDLPLQGSEHTIDLNMQPYTSVEPSADEVISAYLIHYKQAAASHDIGIEDVIRPSQEDRWRRENPSVLEPRILVKNYGSETARQMDIRYGTKGFAKKQYTWQGTLHPGTTTLISLPGLVEGKAGGNDFEVEVLRINRKKDQYATDNRFTRSFEGVPVQDSVMVVYLLTNNQATQNGYVLVNGDGKVVKERPLGSLAANTLYRDTLRLPKGAYQITFHDTAGNGLEFWANPRGGRGKLRLLNLKDQMIKDFEADFGSSVQYSFRVGGSVEAVKEQYSFGLFPTRTNDKTSLDYFANFPRDVIVRLITDPGGQVVEEHQYKQLKEGIFTYDLSRFPKGRFYLSVWIGGEERFKKRIRLKE